MSTALDLLGRELALLLLLSVLGSGPASCLPRGVPALCRLALAPAFGLAVGAAVLSTVVWFVPLSAPVAWAVLGPLLALSATMALWRSRAAPASEWRRRLPRDLLPAALVVVGVASALNAPLISEHSLGPMGYRVADAGLYVAQHEAFQHDALKDSQLPEDLEGEHPGGRRALGSLVAELPPGDREDAQRLLVRTFNLTAAGFGSVAAATDSAFGWLAIDTQSAFMVALVLIGCLGVLAVVLELTGRRWPALCGALLFAGPVTYLMFIDSSEAALAGLSLIPSLVFVAILLVEDLSWQNGILLGLLAAGFQSVYGPMVPTLAAWGALALLVIAVRAARSGSLDRDSAVRAGAILAGSLALAAILSPVSFVRNVEYLHIVATTDVLEVLQRISLPPYDLGVDLIPSWLLGTREFYDLPSLAQGGARGAVRTLFVPLALTGLIVLAVVRWPRAWLLVLVAPVVAVLAFTGDARQECSYCVQRALLPADPIVVILIAAGLGAIAAMAPRGRLTGPRLTAAAALAALATLAVAARNDVVLAQRAGAGGYVFSEQARSLIAAGGDHLESVHLESPQAASPTNPLEVAALYHATEEVGGEKPSVYLPTPNLNPTNPTFLFGSESRRRPRFSPGYRFVLTRVPGVDSGRETIERRGPFALQRRNAPFDVTVNSGVAADQADRDPSGNAWVQAPLRFLVAPTDYDRPGWLRLVLRGPAAAETAVPPRVEVLRRQPGLLRLCAPRPSTGVERMRIALRFPAELPAPPPEEYSTNPVPPKSLRLAAMRVSGRPCR
ncbi:MAG: hypothetical protein AABM29_04610 [Actinomycetota bacterium]